MSFTGGGFGRRGACTTKGAYASRQFAEKVADRMAERYGYYRPGLEVVECRYKGCGKFHIKHKLGKDRKGRRWK
jgi:hypothetical protein